MGRRRYDYDDYGGWPPYVPVAERRRRAMRQVAALRKQGHVCAPVAVEGRTIARSFWGKAWCDNLEAYSDFENRLPRGRTYVRNGSVVDLQIEAGKVHALVAGSELYRVHVGIGPVEATQWQGIVGACAGKIDSVIELLQGRLSHAVMDVVTRAGTGLFPTPGQIVFDCTCPDGAYMCKHVAAVLYGVGARLDAKPELLFLLRHVDPQDLIRQAGALPGLEAAAGLADDQRLDTDDLAGLFGIELDDGSGVGTAPAAPSGAEPPAAGRIAPRSARRAGSGTVTPQRPAKRPATASGQPKRRRARGETVTARTLVARGIPQHVIQSWLKAGVLEHTGQRGVYRTTERTEERLQAYLVRSATR